LDSAIRTVADMQLTADREEHLARSPPTSQTPSCPGARQIATAGSYGWSRKRVAGRTRGAAAGRPCRRTGDRHRNYPLYSRRSTNHRPLTPPRHRTALDET
jgi:hypothetical protein